MSSAADDLLTVLVLFAVLIVLVSLYVLVVVLRWLSAGGEQLSTVEASAVWPVVRRRTCRIVCTSERTLTSCVFDGRIIEVACHFIPVSPRTLLMLAADI
jgi:hypothetical protein